MEHMTAGRIAGACRGKILTGDPGTPVDHISLNSNEMKGNDLFVPLIGEKTDAHRYLLQAFEHGAAAAFTSEHSRAPEGAPGVWIQVDDTKRNWGDTAAAV